jgi:hypothetical protein
MDVVYENYHSRRKTLKSGSDLKEWVLLHTGSDKEHQYRNWCGLQAQEVCWDQPERRVDLPLLVYLLDCMKWFCSFKCFLLIILFPRADVFFAGCTSDSEKRRRLFFFVWGKLIMGNFLGFFKGAETFLIPKLSWASLKMPHYICVLSPKKKYSALSESAVH